MLRLDRAKKRRQVHCAAVRSDDASSIREERPIWISISAMRSEAGFGNVMAYLVSNRNYIGKMARGTFPPGLQMNIALLHQFWAEAVVDEVGSCVSMS